MTRTTYRRLLAASMIFGLAAAAATGAGAEPVRLSDSQMARVIAGDSQAQTFLATRELQELSQQFNMQYLMLQQQIQGENRQFTALSNVMKTKHDTAKNALNNLK